MAAVGLLKLVIVLSQPWIDIFHRNLVCKTSVATKPEPGGRFLTLWPPWYNVCGR